MKVLSLFDGLSGGRIALDRLGFDVEEYYASEIDKHAIKVAQHNYPNTIHIGSVVDVDTEELPFIDLLVGGSPCQGFSFSGTVKGSSTKCNIDVVSLEQYLELKEQKFEFNGQSYLFWEYMRVLTALRKKNPNIKFLLENVIMTQKWQCMFDEAIGTPPIMINSRLVSAQNRRRLYWTNIQVDGQPTDKGIALKDILENKPTKVKCGASRGRYTDKEKTTTIQMMELRTDDKTNTLTTVQKDNYIIANCDLTGQYSMKNFGMGTTDKKFSYRKLSPIECERLQTVPDDYTSVVSDTQRCKMLGNGWTIDVICHLLKNVNKVAKPENINVLF